MRRRFFLSCIAPVMVAACSSSDQENDSSRDQAEAADQGASAEARMLFTQYIDAEGEDFEACFGDLPQIDADPANAQFEEGGAPPGAAALNRVIVAIDASGSMAGRVGGQTKMIAAKDAASAFVASLPDNVEVGLMAFGHRGDNSDSGKAQSCEAVETIYALGSVESSRVTSALRRFDATGWTPLALAIEMAGRSFRPGDLLGSQVVYVVSDGEETCDGDPVAAARALHESDVQAVVNVIGFDLAAKDRAQLRAVAEAGGGVFVEAETPTELSRKIEETTRGNRNNYSMNRSTIRNSEQSNRNAIRTNRAVSKLSTCISMAWSQEKRGLRGWLEGRVVDNETAREIRGLIDTRRDGYRERADAYKSAARQRQQDARDVLEADQRRAHEDYERVSSD